MRRDTFEDIKTADQKGRIVLGVRFAGRRFAVQERPDGTAVLTPVIVTAETERPLTGRRLAESFAAIDGLEDDWDGRGSLAPHPATVAFAREALALIQASALARGLRWVEPHVGCNERGQITLEWWRGDRALTLFVRSPERIDFLKSWGSDLVNEMEDGELIRIADFVNLSHWLYRDGEPAE